MNCLLCHRPLGEHSLNTADICNMFIGGEEPHAPIVKAWHQLEALRAPEGNTVTLICDNRPLSRTPPEGALPNHYPEQVN